MNLPSLFILILTSQFALGQFTDSISQITFQYNKGHYTFGKSGLYSVGEIIEYTKTANNDFRIKSYLQLKKHFDSATNSITIDTNHPKFSNKAISTERVKNLFIELNRSKDNFNAAYVKPYLKTPTKKEIRSIAKKADLDWMFDNEYSDRSERREIYKAIKQYQLLDSFLIGIKPTMMDIMIVTDVWNALSISCNHHEDTAVYKSQFFETFGQPVIRIKNEDFNSRQTFVNLEINNQIKGMLPKHSFISNIADLNQCKGQYIKWIIENEFLQVTPLKKNNP